MPVVPPPDFFPPAQLHGDGARASFFDLPPALHVLWVVHVGPDGAAATPLPSEAASAAGVAEWRRPAWLVVDGLKGGSGVKLDWAALRERSSELAREAERGWLLAGGLGPDNVAEATRTARPGGVDVSSGVCGADARRKDLDKVRGYCSAAREEGGGR